MKSAIEPGSGCLYVRNNTNLTMPSILLLALLLCPHTHQAQERADADELFRQAREMGIAGRRAEARQICKRVLEYSPDNRDARILLGRLYAWDGEYDQARRELTVVVLAKPDYADAREALIDVELWSSSPREALRLSEEGLEIEPENSRLLYRKARALEMLKQMSEARDTVSKALALDPANPDSLALLRRVEAEAQPYRLRADYTYDSFSQTLSNWHLGSLSLTRTFPFGSIGGRLNLARRFDQTAAQFEVDAYPNFGKGSYAYLSAGFSSQEGIFPKFRFGGEYYQNLSGGFEASAGIRYLRFNSSSVTSFTGSVGKYHKNYWVSFRPYFSPSLEGASVSGYLTVRRYFSEAEDYLTVIVGSGSSPDGRPATFETYRFKTHTVNLDFRKRLYGNLSTILFFGFENQIIAPDNRRNRLTAGIGIEKRF